MSRVRDMLERGLDVWFAPIDPINQRFFETVFATSFLFAAVKVTIFADGATATS